MKKIKNEIVTNFVTNFLHGNGRKGSRYHVMESKKCKMISFLLD